MRNNISLSHIISQSTPAYGNRDRIFIRDNSSILKGETANSSCWIFSNNHIGTHIDSPRHFSATGRKTQEFDVNDFFYDKVVLVDIPCTTGILISIEDFKKVEEEIERDDIELLLIRTGYEQYRTIDKYWNDSPGLAAELADYFRNKYHKLRCVGFDFISLTSWNFRPEGRISHKAFLCPTDEEKTILVIEDMALAAVNNSIRSVIVAPMFVEDGNGGAVTVFADIEK
ncbi:cyclase family protein [Mucilaginibacter sp. BJC16-A38]|uniref:cyclase family protein n=1 Tax=Mucilaginibacter phenanthrenivorans TaxID=1234842 RepID=UPI0021570E60|nr:cyclase family protein [Mucilaginibacter phenanthrenivorans]MCR8559733.1 cyclase family protein [Mucilaginibacter phenanthrenivorans]